MEYDRKQEAKRIKAVQEERKKKAAEAKLRKDMLEAAFDGEVDDLKRLMAEVRLCKLDPSLKAPSFKLLIAKRITELST